MTEPLACLAADRLRAIRLLATDIDGTMTHGGRLGLQTLETWARASARGLHVLLVTGRSAGEALGLARYLPHATWAIAENGARLLVPDQPPELLVPPRPTEHLLDVAYRIGGKRPLRPAADAFARLGDLAFERDGRSDADVESLRQAAQADGVFLIWSSVHIHLSAHAPDKGLAVLQVAQRLGLAAGQIATIGDSHNDEGLWQSGRFAITVGTAETASLDLRHTPDWRTAAPGGSGWCEFVGRWLEAHGEQAAPG